jgi:hypothetical protein
MAGWEAARRALLRSSHEANLEKVRQGMPRQGMGIKGAWLFVMACFGWPDLKNRHAVGG